MARKKSDSSKPAKETTHVKSYGYQVFDYANGRIITWAIRHDKSTGARKLLEREINDTVMCVIHRAVLRGKVVKKRGPALYNANDHEIGMLNSYIRTGITDYSYLSTEINLCVFTDKLIQEVFLRYKPLSPNDRANALYPEAEAHITNTPNKEEKAAYIKGCKDQMEIIMPKAEKVLREILAEVYGEKAIERKIEYLHHEITGE